MGQQTKSTKSKPRKRRNDGGNRVVFIIAAVLMVIYLGGRLSNAFSAAPETTPALHVTVNDSFTSDGWFFRDEEPIDNATGSSVKHIVYSGERVQQDAPLAIIYSDQESMDLSRQLDPLEERISLLDTALQSTSDSSNIAKLDQVITLMDRTFSPALPKGEMTKSMVNNYVKVGMIPRPVGKKYDREHLAMLLMICVFKQALSMESISRLLGFLCERDVRTGYDQFCAIIRRIEESAKGGCIELFGDEMDEREMALRSGVMAALCTIHTCRLLEKERA